MQTDAHEQQVTISVNHRSVVLPQAKTTGQEIKGAAVAQGVPIKPNFSLYRVTGATQHPVGDDEKITVHGGQEFRAVAKDDNS